MTTTMAHEGTKTAKAKKVADKANGVILAKVDRLTMNLACQAFKITYADDAADETIVLRLAAHFKEHFKKTDLIECDVCEGESPSDYDCCPFCGESDESRSTDDEEKTPPAAAAQPPPASKAAKAPKAPKETRSKAEIATAALAAPPTNGLAKRSTASAKVVVVDPDEARLDKAVAEVHRVKQEAAASAWELGAKIGAVYDDQLWKLRKDEKGAPKYKGFDPFCAAELTITPRTAYRLMDVAKNFAETDVKAFGTAKLGLLLMAPEEDRPAIKDKIAAGASKKEVAAEVGKARTARGVERMTTPGRKEMPAGEKARAPRQEKITVASIVKKRTVPLYGKPSSRKADLADLKRAKRMGDVPWGRMELENKVVMYFQIREDAGGQLELIVDTRREEE